MGCNYYLYKKDSTKWLVPINSLGRTLECSIIKSLERGDVSENDTLALNINKCISEEDGLHIGKSSIGWYFSLCIYPSLNIYNLKDWETLFGDDAYIIKNEYGDVITPKNMLDCITNRKAIEFDKYKSLEEYEKETLERTNKLESVMSNGKSKRYDTYDDFLKSNHATRGKFGLLSHISNVWDERYDDRWKGFSPMLSSYYPTNGTYDLTTEWDFS